ncbi:FkbM family methyltransferase [Porticoccaceae bacterium]|nr:FkbM family methyltransferase [Porticoccaceae bacterium]MDA8652502.1 FkbM family methyltransferase [Porticoccaceae bacterium]MDC0494632.1 FkbM family methyltransferase [bacterium]
MGKPKAGVPNFSFHKPWSTYAPSTINAALLKIAHRVPVSMAFLTKPLRRPIKYYLTTPIDLTIWGFKLRLLPRGNMSEQKLYTAPQLFDREELSALKRCLSPGSVFIDVGANIGIYSYWAHKCMQGNGSIIAVEPDSEMRQRLAFNATNNNMTNIEISPVALSDREATAEFYINSNQRGENTLDAEEAARAGGTRSTQTVQLMPLITLIEKYKLRKIDALKIDIEGHEPTVLKHFLTNAPQSLWPKLVISEFKHQTAKDILELFKERGYRQRTTTKLNFILELT